MPFWAVFGDFDTTELQEMLPWSSWLVWVYVLISNVVLVNLLVAMFSDTYARVQADGRPRRNGSSRINCEATSGPVRPFRERQPHAMAGLWPISHGRPFLCPPS